ncbi:hypothetical protein FRX31_009847 [Thalictrum thalictroides]|uniref:Secreted protein n=1 Tax=Thalictrum thalictroides TaxID=46969 RepID=A0A7J6WT60_THATH|nr:hypothetical protein FRX31_009847 [Thalictrum thalictroides]
MAISTAYFIIILIVRCFISGSHARVKCISNSQWKPHERLNGEGAEIKSNRSSSRPQIGIRLLTPPVHCLLLSLPNRFHLLNKEGAMYGPPLQGPMKIPF